MTQLAQAAEGPLLCSEPTAENQQATLPWLAETQTALLPVQAELHLHIEGTLEPAQLLELSKRNGLQGSLPFHTLEEAKAAYNFRDLQARAGCFSTAHSSLSTLRNAAAAAGHRSSWTSTTGPRPQRS